MAKVGTAECCSCYEIHPKPEMHQVTSWAYSGGGRREYFDSRGDRKGYSQSAGSFTPKTHWMCAACYEKRPMKWFRPGWALIVIFAAWFSVFLFVHLMELLHLAPTP